MQTEEEGTQDGKSRRVRDTENLIPAARQMASNTPARRRNYFTKHGGGMESTKPGVQTKKLVQDGCQREGGRVSYGVVGTQKRKDGTSSGTRTL